MYLKKSTLVIGSVILIFLTIVLTIGAVNPFGFQSMGDFLAFTRIIKLVDGTFYQEPDRIELLNGAISGMTAELDDPYSGYLWGEDALHYLEEVSGTYCGIGLYIENDMEDNTIRVVSAIAGGSAEEAGITTGDKILKVEGTAFSGEEINEATSAMRGEEGTEVLVTIQKVDGSILDLTLERREIELPNVTGEMLTETVGRISITQFSEESGDKFRRTYQDLKKEGMESLVLDLRNNPGGILDEALEIAEMFVEKDGLIVYTEDRYGEREEYFSQDGSEKLPIVLLTNEGSASASEILTGALKDYGLGYQIGETTYGKGVVQGVYPIGEEGVLSLTVSQYYTPKGVCIHEKGIKPDLEIAMDLEKYQNLTELEPEEDEQLQAALEYLNR